MHCRAALLLLGLVLAGGVQAERDGSSSAKLVDEKGAAAFLAREGRDLAQEERKDASGLTRREKAEEKRLERELKSPDGGRKDSSDLTGADRKADAKVSARGADLVCRVDARD